MYKVKKICTIGIIFTLCLDKLNNIKHLSRLMVFAVVAKKGSFTEAAEELGITKSAVSQQIKLLESEIGQRLLNRTTRGVALTALGDKLLLHCRLLQDQVGMAFSDITNAGASPKGRFAVTFPYSLASTVVMPAIEQLCREFPGLEPDLHVSDKTLDLVANNLDVAIHIGALPDSSYRSLLIGTVVEILCASPIYLNRASLPTAPEALPDHRWIATSWQHRNTTLFNEKNKEEVALNLTHFAHVNSLSIAIDMVLHHMGIALLPDIAVKPFFQSGELTHVMNGFTGPHWPVYFLHPYQQKKPVHINRFYQLIQIFFPK